MQKEIRIPERNEVSDAHKWDLGPLFKNDEEWESLFKEIESGIAEYSVYKGRLHESIEIFKKAMDFDLRISRSIEKLYAYAHLKSDEDKTNQKYLGIYGRAINLHTRIAELSSYMTPEIQSIPDEIMTGFLNHPLMTEYKFLLERIIRFKPYTLSSEIEEILAMGGEVAGAPSQFFSQLDNADMKFGNIKTEDGSTVELSHGNFISFLMSPDRDTRKNSFKQYYTAYENHKHCLAASFSYSLKKDHFYSRVRRFQDSRSASLFPDNVEKAVYDNLIQTVKDNLEGLFKYLNFRKKALGVRKLHFYDTYVPIVTDISFNMPYEEAVDTCIKALKPLGDDYTETLRNGLLNGWVDRYENRGKRSGAYSSGCFDSPPYILMNYRDDNINSLYTLIHEAGHSMHSFYSKRNQPYQYHDYTIFVAEVASTFNEVLLSDYLLKLHKDDAKMKSYIINREIDNIRGTIFRQTMFAEFEKITHQLVEENNPLTLETITNVYMDLLKVYFGNSLIIDDELALECLRIPHFYSAFYVYKYATGISAAISLARGVLQGDIKARDNYRRFLTLGGSLYPLDELKIAGVDMTTPEPVNSAIRHFDKLVLDFMQVCPKLKEKK